MRYKLLGRTGLRVSELCLGAMTFGEDWGWGASREECRKMLDAFVRAGGNFIDTANHYTNGSSERIVGELIASDRQHFVVATKYTLNGRPEDPNAGGNHRKSLVQALEASLKRLQTDYLDLYWVHAWDPLTPVDELMRALDDVVRAGKVLYVGISDAPAWVVSWANTLADFRGWSRFAALQIQYSLVERAVERDLLPMAEALDLAVTPWATLGGGMLTGKYRRGAPKPSGVRFSEGTWGDAFLTERNFAIAAEVEAVAREIGRTPAQVALNWVRQQERGVIIPILGARRLEQIQDNLGCLDFELAAEHLQRLDEVSRIELGFPHDFLRLVEGMIYGKTRPLIDDHRRTGPPGDSPARGATPGRN
jgi:aryl-alcohol dehydrogenase-like predicted oxidoreductase